ncbi:uncharacterized protein [Nicotiana tomentosiformis]|uniref:uncharacterized protein n=1 Tax=Nicotiana tomentosiformis TaxID=4098 RepID=UPI00388CA086
MIDLIKELDKLGCKLGKELSQDLILQSLSESFSQFVINFNVHKMDCDLHEKFNMLIDYENQLASEKKKVIVMLVGNSSKKKGKGKSKPKKKPITPKGVVTKPKGKEGRADESDAECFHCKKIGHWKRNCKEYHVTLKDKKQASMLDKRGFRIIIGNGICSIYYDDNLYVNGYLQYDVYVLPNGNANSIMHVSSLKRKRDDKVNHTYFWHYRLGHIGEKRINKMYKEGYLDKYDFESYPICESCLKRKMTKSPFTRNGERASELLRLIHTDICGPMKIQARGGYSYFITFADDMSRHRFVYLMKHKFESFESSKGSVVKLRNRLVKVSKY